MSSTTADTRPGGSTTSPDPASTLGSALARDWWMIALRGVLGVVFGLIALFLPGATILALVLLFSAYMLVDGVFNIVQAIRAARRKQSWGIPLLQGIASIAAGVLAFLWPGITVFTFVILIAAWSIVTGCLMLGAARSVDQRYGRWWFVLGGLASVMFGFLLIISPLIGAVVLTWWIGAFALVLGVALIVIAFRLRAQKGKPASATASTRPAT
jgi:uncharacterized membrane protein HdeD (DUF308 family)